MPASIVLVHDDTAFRAAAASALKQEGLEVVVYADALAAMNALEAADKIEVLITKLDFGEGRSNGAALVHMARSRKSRVAAIFIGHPRLHRLVEDLGDCFPEEVDVGQLVAVAQERLQLAKSYAD